MSSGLELETGLQITTTEEECSRECNESLGRRRRLTETVRDALTRADDKT